MAASAIACIVVQLWSINDFPKVVQCSTVSIYADDTTLCLKSKDISQLNRAMKRDLADHDA